MKKNLESGQTIIEVLVALSIGVVVIAAISTSVINSLSNAQFSKNQNSATQYAQQGVELARQIKSSNYTNFSSLSGNYCLAKGQTAIDSSNAEASSCGQNFDQFTRDVAVEQNSCDCGSSIASGRNVTKVTVSVGWSDSKCSAPTPIPGGAAGAKKGIVIVPDCISQSLSSPNAQFCHRVQLVSCLSNVNVAPSP